MTSMGILLIINREIVKSLVDLLSVVIWSNYTLNTLNALDTLYTLYTLNALYTLYTHLRLFKIVTSYI